MRSAILILGLTATVWSWAGEIDPKSLMRSQFGAADVLSLDILSVGRISAHILEISYHVRVNDNHVAINDMTARARFLYSKGKWVLSEVFDMEQTLNFSTGQTHGLR